MVGGEILTYLCEEAKLCVLPDTTAILLKLEQVGLKHYLGFVFSWICYGTLTEDYYHEVCLQGHFIFPFIFVFITLQSNNTFNVFFSVYGVGFE